MIKTLFFISALLLLPGLGYAGNPSAPFSDQVVPADPRSSVACGQPGGGPCYVGNLTPANVAWWQNVVGATVVHYNGTLPTPRQGAALYQIIQPASATNFLIPNYIGDLLPADVTWWQTQAGASVTLYNSTGAATPPIL